MRDLVNYMNPATLDLVLNTIPSLKIRKWLDLDIQFLFKIMYWLALRPNEAIRLEKADFDLPNRIVYLGKTKTHKNDVATIPKIFEPELRGWLLARSDGPLFKGLTYKTFYVWLKKLGKQLNIPAWTIPQSESGEKTVGHIFRKTILKDLNFGTHGKKIDPSIIAAHARHENTGVLYKHYLKLGHEAVKTEI